MTKKLILILLCVLMILLPSCAEEPTCTYPSVELSEETKDELRKVIEGDRIETFEIGVSELESEIQIKQAWWCQAFYAEDLEKYLYAGHEKQISEGTVILDETELFPKSRGRYVYVLFRVYEGYYGLRLRACTSATLTEGVLSFAFEEYSEEYCWAGCNYLGVLKIKKSSLAGDIQAVEVTLNRASK